MIVGSSSLSSNSASPDVENTPALVGARLSAVLRAVSDDLHRMGVSAFRCVPLPALNAWTR